MSEGWNEIVVDGRGNLYLNSPCFRLGKEEFRPGILGLVTPDGSVRQVADDIAFPNGMVVTPDNATLIVAESFRQAHGVRSGLRSGDKASRRQDQG